MTREQLVKRDFRNIMVSNEIYEKLSKYRFEKHLSFNGVIRYLLECDTNSKDNTILEKEDVVSPISTSSEPSRESEE